MGTRNLTAVYMDGEYKVAQYGQWDGYPEGQGIICLHFLRDKLNEKCFKDNLNKLRFIKDEELKALTKEFGARDDGTIRADDYEKFRRVYPELHRDTGAKILEMIQEGRARILNNDINFAADGLFCEWAWVIDFDKRTFEAYQGFKNEPLTENDRFYYLRDLEENGYSGVHIVHEWKLDELPTDEVFLSAFVEED